ncbi:hypothetical protein BKI52_32750 [marine bacterium AO1-C]|nr:hypothetical protein BKI52_32750 [marine bacterium AO1-C]
MATVSFISPKLMLNKIAEAIYTPTNNATKPPEEKPLFAGTLPTRNQPKKTNPTKGNKLNVSIDDVKIISASLIHYKKFLARKKQLDKADEVGEVDKKFMAFIQALEGFPMEEEEVYAPPKVQKPQRQKVLKRTLVTQDIDPNKEYKTPKLPQETLQTEWVVKKPKTKKRSAPQFVR